VATATAINKAIAAMNPEPTYSLTDLDYMTVVCNPFGDGCGGAKALTTQIPDDSDEISVGLTLTATQTFLGASGTHCAIKLHPYVPSVHQMGQILYGGTVDTGTPASVFPITPTESSLADTVLALGINGARYRLVSAGVRVNWLSAAQVRAGRVVGVCNRVWAQTAVTPTYASYPNAGLDDCDASHDYDSTTGFTIRTKPTIGVNNVWHPPPSAAYAGVVCDYSLPFVYISGLAATDVLRVDSVEHWEVIVAPKAIPFSIWDHENSEEFDDVVKKLSDESVFPLTSAGHSFSSAVKSLAKAAKTLGKKAYAHREELMDVLKAGKTAIELLSA